MVKKTVGKNTTARKKTATKGAKTKTTKTAAKSASKAKSKTTTSRSKTNTASKTKAVVKGATTKKSTTKTTAKKPAAKKTAAKKPSAKKPAAKKETTSITSSIAEAMFADAVMNEDQALERQAERDRKMRDLCTRLAISQPQYDEMANLELAANVIFNYDHSAIDALIWIIESGDDVHGQDAAKVIAEVAGRDADLIEPELDRLVALMDADERMLPFVLCAIAPMAHQVVGDMVYYTDMLWQYVNETETDIDMAQLASVKILSAMCGSGADQARVLAGGLVDLLAHCRSKDVAVFAEAILPALGDSHSHRAKPVLDRRIKELAPAEVARLRRAIRAAQLKRVSHAA